MKRLFEKRGFLILAASLLFSSLTAAQTSHYTANDIPPPTTRAVKVKITKGPELELARDNEAIIRWTSTNPGGTDEHFGLVKYGTDPNQLNLTAKPHIRLNREHPYTVFRTRIDCGTSTFTWTPPKHILANKKEHYAHSTRLPVSGSLSARLRQFQKYRFTEGCGVSRY